STDIDEVFFRTRRTVRRRRVARGVAALVLVGVVVSAGVVIGNSGRSARVRVIAPAPTTTATKATTAITPGFRLVSYRGVHVEVPIRWPVVDGMHTLLCGGTFPETPTAFIGPQENFPPNCPYMTAKPLNGVWLQPGVRPSDARPVTTPSGQTVLEENPGRGNPVRLLWYHEVLIEIGLGREKSMAKAIFDSIGFTPDSPDTPAAGVCARIDHPDAMPTPERLTAQLVLEAGNVTLDPPAPTDQPNISAAEAWKASGPRMVSFERYRLILARYSAKFPANLNKDGSLTPADQKELAWIVYSTPTSPTIPGCGAWGVNASNALTGRGIGSSSYGPGP
ncbi:MAG: hypothetical protein QOH10_1035, partial [Actinomycetota bacterium]|nr:hypothetical protein [Actinomycetota bacterium]